MSGVCRWRDGLGLALCLGSSAGGGSGSWRILSWPEPELWLWSAGDRRHVVWCCNDGEGLRRSISPSVLLGAEPVVKCACAGLQIL